MKKLLLLTLISIIYSINAQTYNTNYAEVCNQVSQNNLNTYLQEFQDLGVKTTGSPANNNTFNWLKDKYLSFGYESSTISQDNFTYNGKSSANLIVTKTGYKYPNIYLIVCGHYDTINGPGANDNGSGTSVILEAARLLKDIPTEYSIKFIHFSGEEQGLIGSQHYVNYVVNATNPKMNIRLVLNIDEVGGVKGKTNNKVICERDLSNPSSNNSASNTFTQQLITCVGLYSDLQGELGPAYASDYMPFQSNGEIITGLFEYNESSYPHTSNDTIANLDPVYIFNIAKATTGAIQHFAVADKSLAVKDAAQENFHIYPNPVQNTLNLQLDSHIKEFSFSITSVDGKLINVVKNQHQIDISNLPKGVYWGILNLPEQTLQRKFIKE